MRSINEYKRRFNTLLESKMGDVKPLISEAPQFEEFVVPTLDMMKSTNVYSKTKSIPRHETSVIGGNPLNHEKSLIGGGYKLTLPEGMYEPSEMIFVGINMDPILKLTDGIEPVVWDGRLRNIASDNVLSAEANKRGTGDEMYESDTRVKFKFRMPETQKELEENSPFITYVDFPCLNVRGGKLRFSVEVPSGSEIFELEKPVPTPTPNENYKPVPTPTYNPDYRG